MRSAALVLIIALGAAPPAKACRICFPIPKKSIADRLIECESAVLAREDPERPFHYRATELLKGARPNTPLGLFVDSGTRRDLRLRSDCAVLLTKNQKGAWQRVTLVDTALLPIIRDVLKLAPGWRGAARYEYFSRLFGHEHPVIRELAHLEVARAPYSNIRALGRRVPRAKIRAVLDDARYMEWWALHILLLAQSEDARDRKLIIDTVRSMERFSRPLHLAAWATAYLEVEGGQAIEFFERHYFGRSRTVAELRSVVMAFSVVGGGGRMDLRDRIVAGYQVLLENHTELASAVLDDLISWKCREMRSWTG